MRLIDADALKYELFADNYSAKMTNQEVAECIDNSPTIDAVPVIRCKECMWFMPKHIKHKDGSITYVDENAPPVNIGVGINVQAKCCRHGYIDNLFVSDSGNDYCSYGAKMEDKPCG